ncbi:NAD(+) synthase [Caldovatus aquaticus]|uniref:Glutamine-dependent NAD(+) synthetase n=1 Tax=Caldovatus aquaticus TaxID=2865671 RepID=A0ABS7EZH5_9PROT|nr:NAD(+) synthase [Caldovatus aquaticus]MBW8267940.1 NAD(+) synthase [Caldovatus aquaticus]
MTRPVARPFRSLYRHGFVRVAVATPRVALARPRDNLARTLDLAQQASERQAILVLFPELGLSGYSNEDLLLQDALLDAVEDAIAELAAASRGLAPVLVVGAPLRARGTLFNCAVVLHRGAVLGVVAKAYLPNYREFYERRHFLPGAPAAPPTLRLCGREVPFGTDLLFEAEDHPDIVLHVEICEDLWVPIPPSTYGALAGATLLANLSASNVTIGKAEYRRLLCASQSARCIAAYLYASAGQGESTTDLAWDGHAMVFENGELLAEGERFAPAPGLVTADIDLDRLRQDRARMTSFADCAVLHRDRVAGFRRVPFRLELPAGEVPLERAVPRFPYVPADPATRDARCEETYSIQVVGLAQRLEASGIRKAVIGVSGGLDSALALLVTVGAFDRLGLPRRDILAYTMPGFGTSARTRGNAWALMRALGVSAAELDIRPAAEQMLRDIGHPAGRGEPVHDITFENVQAGERASHLFRLANLHGALVIGTGDLSELALGYTTYGVGDHMAHYNVNASVPKTLVQHLLRWAAATGRFGAEVAPVLRAIADTAISPELVPAADREGPGQRAEETIGPYALQDFNLYHLSRFGYRPGKVAFLALHAWGDAARGAWPDTVPPDQRIAYDLPTIEHWLAVFLRRFFQTSQFKRSAMPDGPKVGSGGSLSPRGDWRAPSDASAEAWLEALRRDLDRQRSAGAG